MTSILGLERVRVRKKWDVIRRMGLRGWSVLEVQSLLFLLKQIRFGPWLDIMLMIYYWQQNLPFDSDIRQWSHPLMIPLRCLWAKTTHRKRGQFKCDVTLFLFWFLSFTWTVWLLFHTFFTVSRCANKIG